MDKQNPGQTPRGLGISSIDQNLNEDILRAVIEAVPVAIIGLDLEGRVQKIWNHAAEKLLGWKAEEVFGKFLPTVPQEAQEEFKKFREMMRIGMTLNGIDVKRQRKDETLVEYSIYASPFHDDQGNVIGNIAALVDITERKKAQQDLAKREREYQSVLDNIQEFIVRYNKELQRAFVNSAWEKASGLAKNQVINVPYEDIPGVTKPYIESYVEKLRLALETGTPQFHEFSWCNANGKELLLEYSIVPEFDANGEIAGVLAVGRDILDRRKAQLERKKQLYFYKAMDLINRAMQTADDLDQMMDNVLSVVRSIFNCDRAWLVYPCDPNSETWSVPMESSHPDFPGAGKRGQEIPTDKDIAEIFRLALATDGVLKFGPGTDCLLPKEISEIYGIKSYMATALRPRIGKAWEFGLHQCSYGRIWTKYEERLLLEIGRRLTDGLTNLLMHRNLKENENKLKSILENIEIGVSLISPNMEILDLNRRMRKWFPDIKAGKKTTCYKAFNSPPKNSVCEYCPTIKTLRDGNVYEAVTETPYDGNIRNFRIISSPIKDANGAIIAAIEMVEDITEIKRLHELEARAQRLNMAGQVAGQIAHDFNNLLSPITTYPELIKETLRPEDEAYQMLTEIENAGIRLGEINQQLLTLGRRGHYELSAVNLNSILLEVISAVKPIAKGIDIKTSLSAYIYTIMGGEAQLYRAFLNLIINSCDAMNHRGCVTVISDIINIKRKRLTSGNIPSGEYITISISDTGTGIPKSAINKIFDPFFTTKTVDSKRGSGLGLSVVDSVMKDHNGYIDVESEHGKGTTFRLYFPIAKTCESM
ncbi:MAG: PAS domain S-box protein [Candidatus Zixiibacteriota bacterium]